MKPLTDAVPVIDAAYLRLVKDARNDADCELAGELLHVRADIATAAEAIADMVTTAESREAVQVAAVLALIFGIGFGLGIGIGGDALLAAVFG